MDVTTGGTIKGYEILEQIGAGGFGVVYKAYQPIVGRQVAIKIIHPEHANQSEFIRRFESEAQIVAHLEHLHIVPLYDYWRDPEGAYLVTRFMRGGSLHDSLRKNEYDLISTSQLLDQIASALSFAHRNHVVHRDIKPSNILLDEDGNAYLTDFGIAKQLIKIDQESLTSPSMIVGSPDYLSPEQARTQQVSPQTDIFCLGLVLYEMLTGEHPFINASPIDRISKLINDPLPEISTYDPHISQAINAVIHKATHKIPDQRYADALEMADSFHIAIDLQVDSFEGVSVTPRELPITKPFPVPEIKNPYKGLRAFQAADERDFFGRENLSRKLLKEITSVGEHGRFLAVVGPSGSGKSSLVRAGLIPKIQRGEITGSDRWYVADMIPGAHPLDELEVALLQVASQRVTNLREQLERDERGLVRASQLILPDDSSQLMLVVDQFEEIFTLVEDEEQRTHFLDLVHNAVTDTRSRIRVIITLRADYYDRPLQYQAFGELVRSRMETVLPMSASELEQAITGPSNRIGISFEEGLVPKIIEEVHTQPGALPLLQYALTMLFEERQDHTLTLDGYRQVGGAVGALAKQAEQIYTELDAASRMAAQHLFMRLVSPDEEARFARRRTTRTELAGVITEKSMLDKVIDTFASQRLLSLDNDPISRIPTVELAHEAILQEWSRLRTWLDEARDAIRIQRQLTALTEEWINANRDESFSLRGSRLDMFASWAEEKDQLLTPQEREYIAFSIAEDLAQKEHETRLERRSRNFLRGLVGVFAIAAVISLVMFSFARNAQRTAESEAELRATQQVIAQEETNARATQQAIAESESIRAETQARESFARELASSSLNVLDLDPQLSVLLALQAVDTTNNWDGFVLQEAEQALHRAVQGTTNRLIFSFNVPDPYLWRVAISPTGTYITTYSTLSTIYRFTGGGSTNYEKAWQLDGHTIVWNLQTGEQVGVFPGILATGNWIDEDRITTIQTIDHVSLKITQWNILNSEILSETEFIPRFIHTEDNSLQELNLAELDIDTIGISSDGRYLSVSISPANNSLHLVWDLETGQEVFRLERTGVLVSELVDIVISTQDDQMVTGTQIGTLNIWNLLSGELIYTNNVLVTPFNFTNIAEHPLHNFFITASARATGSSYSREADPQFNSAVTVWDFSTGIEQISLVPLVDDIWSVAFNNDGTRIATGSQEGHVTVWNASTGQEIRSFSHLDQPISDIAFSSNNSFLVTTSRNGVVSVWDIRPEFGYELFSIGRDVVAKTIDTLSCTISPDGTNLLTVSESGVYTIRDASTGEQITSFETHNDSYEQVSYSPDGNFIVAISQEGEFILWDSLSGAEILRISGLHGCCFAFHPSGDLIALPTSGLSLGIFSISELIETQSLDRASQAEFTQIYENILDITYNRDGNILAVLGESGYLKIFHLESGESPKYQLPNSSYFASQHHGSLLGIVHNDGSIGIFNSETGEFQLTLQGHVSSVSEVQFSNDEDLIFSASRDGTVKVWDVSSGEELQTIYVHPLGVFDIDLSPNGKHLYAASADGTVRVYLLDIDELIELAYTRLDRWFTPEECRTYLHMDTCPPVPSDLDF